MTITGGGVSSGNTGTTSGSSTGVQTSPGEVAGPIVGLPGTTYNVVETAASGSLTNYTTTWSCLNGSSTFSSGTGTSISVLFPAPSGSAGAALVCTFTNTPASISVTKTPSPTTVTAAGQTITYSYAVTNTGPLPLTNVTVADTQTPPAGGLTSGPTCASLSNPVGTCSGSSVATLAAGRIANFTATYVVTQADMDHGSVADSATATGNAPSGTAVSATATASVSATQTSSISIVKSASPTELTMEGQTITYTFVVTNTGNTDLTGVGVTDHPTAGGPLTTAPNCQGLTNPTGTCSGNSVSLAPKQVATFTGTYVVTETDIDHGSVVDTATAAGTPPTGSPVSGTSNMVTVSVDQEPGITITKSASPTTVTATGQTVTYTFSVHNTGNVDLTSVGVTDVPTAPATAVTATCQSLSAPTGTCSGPTTSLAPGQIATFTGTYAVTLLDLNHGSIVDDATTHGTTPLSGTINATSNTVTVTAAQSPTLSIGKSANPTTVTAAGQNVAYTFSVTNTGNVTVSSVGVTDVPVSPAGLVIATCIDLTSPTGTCSGATTTLVPGQSAIFTGSYTVTQADINHGTIQDTALASGTSPSSTPVTATSSQVTVNVTQTASLTIAKTANPLIVTAAGQPIAYTFTVFNNGNLTLTSVGVTDVPTAPAGGVTATCESLSGPAGTCSGATTTLLPGQTATFTGTYDVSQADINHGSIVDHAIAQGTTPSGGTATSPSSNTVTVNVTQTASLTIAKTANPLIVTAAGQPIAYTFTVFNNGNLTLTSVGVTDVPTAPAGGVTATCESLSGPAGTCSGATTTLLPGQTATFTGTYDVSQADINHGSIVDHAIAQGTTPSGGTATSPSSNTVTVNVTQTASLTIAKTANPLIVTAAGQPIAYTFTVFNNGNLTLTSVGVTDVPTAPAGGVTATCESLSGPAGTCSARPPPCCRVRPQRSPAPTTYLNGHQPRFDR